MATAEQYAEWLVKNKDKKGTKEFNTVAEAYKIKRGYKPPAKPEDVPFMQTDFSSPFTINPMNVGDLKDRAKNITPEQIEQAQSNTTGALRALGQGITFGFADEIEAKIRSTLGEGEYKRVRDEIRKHGLEYAKKNPKTALALEVIGGIATGGAGVAKVAGKGLLRNMGVGAGQSALYGAGQAKEVSDIDDNAMQYGAVGALTAGAFNRLGALGGGGIDKNAKKLLDQGVEITPAQALGGKLKQWEDNMSGFLWGGSEAQERALNSWNKVVANKVLAPLGKKVPDSANTLPKINQYVADLVEDSYKTAYKGATLKNTSNLKANLNNVINEAKMGFNNTAVIDDVESAVKQINKMIGDKGINERSIKVIQNNLKKKFGNATYNAKNTVQSEASEYYKRLFDTVNDEIAMQNPVNAQKLKTIDKAYGDIKALWTASGADNSTVFTPKQLANASNKGINRASQIKNRATRTKDLTQMADLADSVLTNKVPQSGTTPRLATQLASYSIPSLFFGGTSAFSPAVLAGGLGLLGAQKAMYTPAIQKMIVKWINAGYTRQQIVDALKRIGSQAGTAGLITQMDN